MVDPARAENIVTNDGATMRILVQLMGRPSAWSRQKEIVAETLPEIDHGRGAELERAVENTKPTATSSKRQPRPAVRNATRAVGKLTDGSDESTAKADSSETEGRDDTDEGSGVLVESADAVDEVQADAAAAPRDEEEKRELMLADKERERERRAEQVEIAKEKREQDKALRNLR